MKRLRVPDGYAYCCACTLMAMVGCGQFAEQQREAPGRPVSAPQPAPEQPAPVGASTPAPAPPPAPSFSMPAPPPPGDDVARGMRPRKVPSGPMSARPVGRARPVVTAPRPQAQQQVPPRFDAPAMAPNRMVHYQGYLKIVASKPESLIDRATELAKAAGGYVEQLTGNRLTLRVPVAQFREVLSSILELGEVLQRRITAQDITEAYQAVDLRLRVLKASRDRLVKLLAKAAREQEKLSLLNEIKRLTEQIDQLELQQQRLARLAAFSTITIDAVPRPQRIAQVAQQDPWVFRWIGQLSPFTRHVASAGERLELPAPKGMVELDRDDGASGDAPWMARSPDGAAVWTSRRANNPQGDTRFWLAAVKQRLASRYPDHQVYQIGAFSVLELHNRDKPDYRYAVALRVVGQDLQVVEIYYPSAKQQAEYGDAVKQVLQRFSGNKGA